MVGVHCKILNSQQASAVRLIAAASDLEYPSQLPGSTAAYPAKRGLVSIATRLLATGL